MQKTFFGAPAATNGFRDSSFAKNKNLPLHRWVPWIAGFSADFVEDAIRRFKLVYAMGWRVKPAWGFASAAGVPVRKLTTVLLPAPAPPTTARCKGTAGRLSRKG